MIHDDKKIIKGKVMIRAIRKLLGDISQASLAYKIGVSVTTISRWETGASEPNFTFRHIEALEEILAVELQTSFRGLAEKIQDLDLEVEQ